MNLSKNEMIAKSSELVYNILRNKPYGTDLTWDVLLEMSGNRQLTKQQMYRVVNGANSLLMAHDSKCLKTIMGVGKRLMNPDEHVVEARKTVKRSARVYKKAGRIIGSTNLDMLSAEDKERVISDASKFRTLELFHNEMLKKKKITNNRFNTEDNGSLLLNMIEVLKNN